MFCFAPDGTVRIAFFNVPGCFHNFQIADWVNIHDKLEKVFKVTGARCTVDSGFCTSGENELGV